MTTAVMIEPGIHFMSNEDYHGSEPLSKSSLSELLKSPAHYRCSRETPAVETAAMRFGTAFHCAALEPERFAQEYGVVPQADRRTKTGKAAFAEWELQGLKAVSQEDMKHIESMRKALFAHRTLAPLFENGEAELSFFTEVDYYGTPVRLKCRPDWIDQERGVIVDLKTTTDASPSGFARSCARFDYDLQAYLYSMICSEVLQRPMSAFVFAAVEKEPPYGVGGYVLDAESIELGRNKYHRAVETYLACLESGEWPSYGDTIEEITLPKWAFYDD